MAIRIESSLDSPLWFKALIYGPPGGGKTTWTALNVPDPVWVDFERSSDTLKAMKIDVPILKIKSLTDITELRDFCMKIEKSQYKTIVFDTISTSQVFQLLEHMKKKYGEKEARLLPLFQDFRISTQTFNEIFFFLQHAEVNVVLIAHEREFWEGEGDAKRRIAIGPSITPALQESTTQLVNAVLRFQKKTSGMGANKTVVPSMLCNSTGLYIAKNRYGITDEEVLNPTLKTFLKEDNNAN